MANSKRFGGLGLVILVLAVLAGGVGWYLWRDAGEDRLDYSTVTVSRGDITQTVTATGTLQAVTSVDVSSQISGLINEVAVDFNSRVKLNQVLARLDPATYQSRLASAQAQLANATANFNLVRLNTERTRELRAQNLVAQQDLDQAEAQLQQAQAQLQIQQSAVDSAKVDLSRCTIYSPIDGIVIDRQAEVGKTVAASLNAPTLFTIANDLTKMQISTSVAEADIGNVAEGQSVTFTVDAYPNRQFRGRISQIRNAPKTEQNVVTYETMIDVNNADLKLKPGMTANVSIIVAQRANALKLANAALRARIPENLLPKAAPAPAATAAGAAPAPKPMSEDERRKVMREIFREAGFSFGSGPPTPDVIARVQELAKARGIELDLSRWGGRDRGSSNTPVTRTVYRLVGSDPRTQHPEAVSAKFGISDGVVTEVVEGLNDGDVIITSVSNGSASSGPTVTTNPFSGRPMGGRPPGR
ncbi:MAG: efflux RND transporter periplasmic adaptor subunit [Verrucomicrobia bacterium]|nr:efflux RND transporter periplasmic adaptor subunit [Verrucomicrobiota bacterium]